MLFRSLCVRAGDWAAGAAAGRGVGMRGADYAGAAPRAAVRPRWRGGAPGVGRAARPSRAWVAEWSAARRTEASAMCARWRRAGLNKHFIY